MCQWETEEKVRKDDVVGADNWFTWEIFFGRDEMIHDDEEDDHRMMLWGLWEKKKLVLMFVAVRESGWEWEIV